MEMQLPQVVKVPEGVIVAAISTIANVDGVEIARNIDRYIEANKMECGVSNMIARPVKIKVPVDPDMINNVSIPVEVTFTVKPSAKKTPAKKKTK